MNKDEQLQKNKFDLSFEPATTSQEYKELVQNRPKDMICTLEDFRKYIREKKFESIISPEVLVKIEKSLKFCNGGLGGMYYGDLSNIFTFRQFEEFFAHFGVGLEYFCERRNLICKIPPIGNNYCEFADDQYCDEDYCPNC
ncbi:hypothetical protein [Bacillus thuringiensis]|uniref:hypothetical protein n=1 Tax=Bacillus thuringiensis TaxID=1428 RepID=UPI000BFBF306|nr:hypothetical protein [Bacillus thuringiensis]PGV86833.1 hypothetical protein COD85_10320 [Bacillus thuringiensis]